MAADKSQFVFMTCRPGAEAVLKQEVARTDPEWRPAFSRPGFVSFKLTDGKSLDDKDLAARQWVFARTHGISLDKVSGSDLQALAAEVWQQPDMAAINEESPFVDIHVWQRDVERGDDASDAPAVTPLAEEIERAVRAAAPATFTKVFKEPAQQRHVTHRNVRVLDVVVLEPGMWCLGYHRAVTPPQRWPGGAIPVAMPEHAVSRAYAKMEEALAWSGLPLAAEDECVELGCAPGGASQALLDRGMYVTGIDPAEVDPILLEHPRFRHLRKRSKEVRRNEFIGVRWLAADMNLAPNYTLDAAEAVVQHPGAAIRGMILTLKLADWSLAEQLPEFAARVYGWGFRDVRMRQLATGGKEVCLVALRRKELRRQNRKRKSVAKKASAKGERASARGHAARKRKRPDPPHSSLTGPHFGFRIESGPDY
jgi:23S rRNA (cytidine2498-2'-O)-methyltransferase